MGVGPILLPIFSLRGDFNAAVVGPFKWQLPKSKAYLAPLPWLPHLPAFICVRMMIRFADPYPLTRTIFLYLELLALPLQPILDDTHKSILKSSTFEDLAFCLHFII